MVVAPTGSHIHQRVETSMALIVPVIKEFGIEVSAPGMKTLEVPVPTETELSKLKQCKYDHFEIIFNFFLSNKKFIFIRYFRV